METTATPTKRPLFVRSDDDRLLTGVSGGLASALGVDPIIVRIGFALMALGAGLGVLLYAIAFALSEANEPDIEIPARPVTRRHTIGVLCISLGVFSLAGTLGIGLPRSLVFPLILVAIGPVVIWARMDEKDRGRFARNPSEIFSGGKYTVIRFIVGAIILVAGVGLLLGESNALPATRSALLAIFATVVGVLLILGPWLLRLVQQVSDERRERIRTEERAEMSAHLHDSVLNTLALIQRSEASAEVVTLARRQERELRAWMQGRNADEDVRLDAAIDAVATRVEAQYNVTVDVVIVGGDAEMNESVGSFVAAVQEAVVNSARHSGVPRVSVYVEVEPALLTGYVRDLGTGFDRNEVSEDRRGLADSIEGRMKRAGGSASIRSNKGEGTEAELRLPRSEK